MDAARLARRGRNDLDVQFTRPFKFSEKDHLPTAERQVPSSIETLCVDLPTSAVLMCEPEFPFRMLLCGISRSNRRFEVASHIRFPPRGPDRLAGAVDK